MVSGMDEGREIELKIESTRVSIVEEDMETQMENEDCMNVRGCV